MMRFVLSLLLGEPSTVFPNCSWATVTHLGKESLKFLRAMGAEMIRNVMC